MALTDSRSARPPRRRPHRQTVATSSGGGLTGVWLQHHHRRPDFESTATASFCASFDPVAAGKAPTTQAGSLLDNIRAKNGIKLKVTPQHDRQRGAPGHPGDREDQLGEGRLRCHVAERRRRSSRTPRPTANHSGPTSMFTNNSTRPDEPPDGWTTTDRPEVERLALGNYKRYPTRPSTDTSTSSAETDPGEALTSSRRPTTT